GDLGESLFSGRPVMPTILEQAGPTVQLALAGLITASALGFALGVISASAKSSNPIISRSRQHPERSPALLSGAQSKDAIPSQIPIGNRPLRLRPAILRLRFAPLRLRGSPLRLLTPLREVLTIQSGSNFLIALSQSLPVAW